MDCVYCLPHSAKYCIVLHGLAMHWNICKTVLLLVVGTSINQTISSIWSPCLSPMRQTRHAHSGIFFAMFHTNKYFENVIVSWPNHKKYFDPTINYCETMSNFNSWLNGKVATGCSVRWSRWWGGGPGTTSKNVKRKSMKCQQSITEKK